MIALALAAWAACAPPVSIDVDGVTRTSQVFVPPGGAAGAPLVLVLHGRLGTGAQVRTSSGFDDVARTHGFVVAYPDGIDRAWRDLRQVTLKPGASFGGEDVRFLLALTDRMVADHGVDPARVFVVGHSNGAIMALTLACLHADRIAGIAVVAGNLPRTTCALSRPVPALFFHGTQDPLVKFEGGAVGPRGARGFVLSSDESVALFAQRAGCRDVTRKDVCAAPPHKPAGGLHVLLEERSGCAVPITRYVIEGGGHGWPGRGPLWRKNTKELDASAVTGAFFAALKPAPKP